jgi:Right handed beta helix region
MSLPWAFTKTAARHHLLPIALLTACSSTSAGPPEQGASDVGAAGGALNGQPGSSAGGSDGPASAGAANGGASLGGTSTHAGSGGDGATAGTEATGGAEATGGTSGAGTAGGGGMAGGGGLAGVGAGGVGMAGGGAGGGTGVGTVSTACVPGTGRQLHVSPLGAASGDGASFGTALDVVTALARATPGDTLLLQPGKYAIAYEAGAKNTLVLSQRATAENPIRIIAQGGRAVFDFSFPEQAWEQDSYGFLASGDYWSMCRVDVTRAGYQGVYVTGAHNTFENCAFYDNRNTGLEINKGGAYTTVVNCDAYRNYDPKKLGSMADGFGPKQTQGPGNRFEGCRAWENSDDGFDAFDSPETVIIERSFAFRNGVDVWGYGDFSGNGNGFKIGGNAQQANHRLTQCAAFANRVKGFDQNNNRGGITIFNSTAFGNATNFALGGSLDAGQKHDLRNNVSLGAPGSIANANQQNNSWTLGLAVTEGDFESLTIESGAAPRAADGSLPQSDFLRLAPGSALIDAGVDVGLKYEGRGPDLGAFEAK